MRRLKKAETSGMILTTNDCLQDAIENGEPDIRRVISLLEKDLVCVQRINETEHDTKTDTEIFPIELDDNILKKFGFKMKRSDIIPFYFYNEEYDITLSFKNNAYCIETYNTDIMFKYVHQFQHFFEDDGSAF